MPMLARWEVMAAGASRVRLSSGILTMAMLPPSNQHSALGPRQAGIFDIQPADVVGPRGAATWAWVRLASEHQTFDFSAFCQALPARTPESRGGAWPEPGLHPKYKAR